MSFAEHKTTAHAAGGTRSVLETLAVTPQSWMGEAHCLKASLPSPFPPSSRTQPLFSPVPGGCRAPAPCAGAGGREKQFPSAGLRTAPGL